MPYLTHLLSVAALVGVGGGDEDQIIAALLHDWIEDTEATLDDCERQFGPRVTRMVEACSDCLGDPKPPWRDRKEGYLRRLVDEPAEIKLISAADKLHNCRSTVIDLRRHGPQVFSRFNAGRDGTLWYYQQLVPALRNNWDHWILDLLEDEVKELVRLA